jgi:hypothetical protein
VWEAVQPIYDSISVDRTGDTGYGIRSSGRVASPTGIESDTGKYSATHNYQNGALLVFQRYFSGAANHIPATPFRLRRSSILHAGQDPLFRCGDRNARAPQVAHRACKRLTRCTTRSLFIEGGANPAPATYVSAEVTGLQLVCNLSFGGGAKPPPCGVRGRGPENFWGV